MAAALKTLEVIERDGVTRQLQQMGERLAGGLVSIAEGSGFDVVVTGPEALPFMHFRDDPDYGLRHEFAQGCFAQGVFFHPHHNWFLCAAHDEAAIDEALYKAGVVFAHMAAAR